MNQEPKQHEFSWSQNEYDNMDDTISAENRYQKVITNLEQNDIENLKDYDIIINQKESGYRNDGVYIYYKRGIYNLSNYPDDYGSLPKWVKLQKDLGWSYFKNYQIDHNYYTPFKTSEWQICDSYIKENNIGFPMYNCEIVTNIQRDDGVKATINSLVIISFPSMGGPSYDIIMGSGGGSSNTWYQNYTDKYGNKFKITNYNDTGKVIVSRNGNEVEVEQNQEIIMSPNITFEACNVINNKIKDKFNKNEYLYFEAINERNFQDSEHGYDTVITTKLVDNSEGIEYEVIPYEYD